MDIYRVEINSILRCKQTEFIRANSRQHAEEIARSDIELQHDPIYSVDDYTTETVKPEHVNALTPEEYVYSDGENDDAPWEKVNLLQYLKQQENN